MTATTADRLYNGLR